MRTFFLVMLLGLKVAVFGQAIGPRIQFDQTEVDICDIMEGETAKLDFVFRNIGNRDLVLHYAKTSTGAAVADWPKDPLKPGESGMIRVQFLTQGKIGQQSKSVTVACNDSLQPVISLNFKCRVVQRPTQPTFLSADAQQQTLVQDYQLPSTCLNFAQPCKEGMRIQLGSREPLVFYYDVLGNGKPTEFQQLHGSGEVMSVDWTEGPQISGKRDSILVWFDTQTVGPFSNTVIIETSSASRSLVYLHFEGRIVREEPFTMEEGK